MQRMTRDHKTHTQDDVVVERAAIVDSACLNGVVHDLIEGDHISHWGISALVWRSQ